MDDLEIKRKAGELCPKIRSGKCHCDELYKFVREIIEDERVKTFEEATKAIKESRLDLPDEPHEIWLSGFTAAKNVFAVMMERLAATRRE